MDVAENVSAASAIVPAVFQQAVEQADLAISITDARANILYVLSLIHI